MAKKTDGRDGRKKYDREFIVSKIAMMRIKGKSTHTILEFLMEEMGMSRKIAYEILQYAHNHSRHQVPYLKELPVYYINVPKD